MLFSTVSYIKLNFKLKIDQKMCTFNNLEEILKTLKKLKEASGNPVYIFGLENFLIIKLQLAS